MVQSYSYVRKVVLMVLALQPFAADVSCLALHALSGSFKSRLDESAALLERQ